MRILGFSHKWGKLQQSKFTTFRFTRRDKDWAVGEQAQVVYKPRRKGGGEFMGVAEIESIEPRSVSFAVNNGAPLVSQQEARVDGFRDEYGMIAWINAIHQGRNFDEPMNKLTLRWLGKGN